MIERLNYYKPRKVDDVEWRTDIYNKINEIIELINEIEKKYVSHGEPY